MGLSLPPQWGDSPPAGRWPGAQWWTRWFFKPLDPPERRGVVEPVAERSGVVELVGDCLRPPKHDRQRRLPIVLLWDPRVGRPNGGSYGGREPDGRLGPAELLDRLEERFREGRPYVRRNGDELDGRRPHEVAVLLASHLSCPVEAFGRLEFPRLLLGLAAARGPAVDIRRILLSDRRRLIGLLREIAPDVLEEIIGASTGTRLLGLTVRWLLAFSEVPLSVRRGLRWYQDGLGEHLADPFHALARLKECESRTPAKVDEVLCRAFLADLRDSYSMWSCRFFKRDKNCLALLGDTNWKAVRGFLDVLAAQRKGWDPLLIVVAARSHSPNHRHPEAWEFQKEMVATYQDWSSDRKVNARWADYYPLCLDGSCPRQVIP